MSCVVRWWDVLFVKGMHFSSKNARLLNFKDGSDCTSLMSLVALFNILINIDVFGLITSILGKGNH